MELRLVDAIGPFFRGIKRRRLNWSKIPFHDLPVGPEADHDWRKIGEALDEFAKNVVAAGFNAVTLDDVAHLTDHPWYEDDVREKIQYFAERFSELIAGLRRRGLRVFMTSDVVTITEAIKEKTEGCQKKQREFYFEILTLFFARYSEVEGVILRVGESDGLDVHDDLRSKLHLRSAGEANEFLKELLPRMEMIGKTVVLRTWTVGAYRLGDLIWHRGTLGKVLEGISSHQFVLSMKPGDSDFFRYLPLNKAFFRYEGRKILELQARPEYEGAGELPTFLGYQYARYARELEGVENLVGISVWCQTGGWHRFRRLAFFDEGSPWVENNARVALGIFAKGKSLSECVPEGEEFFELLDRVIREAYYIRPFAAQKLFFRRVRIPPLLHVYWDTLFLIAPVRKLMRFFVDDHEEAIREGEEAMRQLPRMLELVDDLPYPREDVEFLESTLRMIGLARRYFFQNYSEELVEEIRLAKKEYKKRWPKGGHARFRIRTDFQPFRLKRRTLRWGTTVMLRRQRGYRFVDYVFGLTVLGFCYRLFRRVKPEALPKFVRESAMGVDSLFK